jgi:transcriptional regulator with XRE-family HTH domain
MKKSGKLTSRSDKTIAARVKTLMDEQHWDQKDLAERLDLSEGYISRILSGERPWPIALVFRAAEVLNVPVSEVDPQLDDALKTDLMALELRRDVPHMKVLYAVIKDLPRIIDTEDLEALVRVLNAFADRSPIK